MPRKRQKPKEIVTKLRQVDVLVSQGQSVIDAIRQIGVTEVVCATNCSTAKSSTRSEKPKSWSKAGGAITIRSDRMNRSNIGRPHPKSLCPPSPRGRLRYAGQLRRHARAKRQR